MIPSKAQFEYMDRLDRERPAHGMSGQGLVSAGYVEYLWRLPDGTLLTDEQYERARVASPGRFIGGRWAGEILTEKGRKFVKRNRPRSLLNQGETDR